MLNPEALLLQSQVILDVFVYDLLALPRVSLSFVRVYRQRVCLLLPRLGRCCCGPLFVLCVRYSPFFGYLVDRAEVKFQRISPILRIIVYEVEGMIAQTLTQWVAFEEVLASFFGIEYASIVVPVSRLPGLFRHADVCQLWLVVPLDK